jgi:hypothetical protein
MTSLAGGAFFAAVSLPVSHDHVGPVGHAVTSLMCTVLVGKHVDLLSSLTRGFGLIEMRRRGLLAGARGTVRRSRHKTIAAAVSRHTQLKCAQRFFQTDSRSLVRCDGLWFDLPPATLHTQAPAVPAASHRSSTSRALKILPANSRCAYSMPARSEVILPACGPPQLLIG